MQNEMIIPYLLVKCERILMKINQTFLLHFAKLFGKGTPVEIQIIGHLLAVKRNLETGAAGLSGLGGKVSQ